MLQVTRVAELSHLLWIEVALSAAGHLLRKPCTRRPRVAPPVSIYSVAAWIDPPPRLPPPRRRGNTWIIVKLVLPPHAFPLPPDPGHDPTQTDKRRPPWEVTQKPQPGLVFSYKGGCGPCKCHWRSLPPGCYFPPQQTELRFVLPAQWLRWGASRQHTSRQSSGSFYSTPWRLGVMLSVPALTPDLSPATIAERSSPGGFTFLHSSHSPCR
jgi:hypothetical protein